MELIVQIEKLRDQALKELKGVDSLESADAWRTAYLGRKGTFTQLLRGLSRVPPAQRPRIGRLGNEAKAALGGAYAETLERLKRAGLRHSLEAERIDVTLPGRPVQLGRLHLSTQTLREIYAIFAHMGFQVEETPEVELDEYNFTLLNIPPYHPARDMWSSFYTTDSRVLLRTHTSPGQIRVMRRYAPEPIRVILPGKCYRYEQITARSEIQFHQVEGLAVGRQISMADLKGVLIEFARQMFGESIGVRFRASHFPFTEPSAEMDIQCLVCGGQGCRVCKYTGWVEILGAGMVHPQVLENGGYDPDVFSGFAFGLGPERITMLVHRIEDIRHFFTNDLRFLEQF